MLTGLAQQKQPPPTLEREKEKKKRGWAFMKKKEFSVVLTSPHLSVLSLFSPFRVAKKLPF